MLPSLAALALDADADADADTNAEGSSRKQKDLVFLMGCVPWSANYDAAINRMYRALVESLRKSPGAVDVVLVDPREFESCLTRTAMSVYVNHRGVQGLKNQIDGILCNEDAITTHFKMTLQEFEEKHPINTFFDQYDRIAIVDDMRFGNDRYEKPGEQRSAIMNSDAFKNIYAYAEAHKDRVAWWVFYFARYDSFKVSSGSQASGMMELNHHGVGGSYRPMHNALIAWSIGGSHVIRRKVGRNIELGEEMPEDFMETLLSPEYEL